MKILLIHQDKFPWAAHRRALEFKKRWIKDEVDITYAKTIPDGDKYDIIHFLFSGGIKIIKEYALKYKNKTFTTLASQRTLDEFYDKKDDLIEFYKETVSCVALNPSLAAQLKSLTKKNNVVYIPNGVDTELFKRSFTVGFVGIDSKESRKHKGYEMLKKVCDSLELILKSADGDIPIEKMPKFYQKIDCLVIPSESEGCNNPTLEALAMNKPVISTITGIAERLTGTILIKNTEQSLTQALLKLSGRRQILKKYSWDIIASRYHELYDRIV